MKFFFKILVVFGLALGVQSCSEDKETTPPAPRLFKYLALGDSYTYGQSVCTDCRFPEQLKDSLAPYLNETDTFAITLIAQTGWTTTNLKTAIANENLPNDYNLVTLLIGVNNQYQNKPFSLYEQEFPELVNTAIAKAGGDKKNLIVVSIPDYAYTPFGQGSTTISNGVQQYNTFAQAYCESNGISFVYITDITQMGLLDPELVATDGLHPSTMAYTQFVERILPVAKMTLGL
ncbi:SGNH/GDSL hydrolase family protein [Flavobacterium sedimenticola]|uniref:SGNH/GDSL hydrolase family protein n=1 Tax=Flavobacterium sedimenticola TaxID=3043286 RepID=A0ABT6XMY3_9FLAO|nr:SGNH/GDSL hydrolase family protein [Flavobacterium sedimenticola]MDI9256451.1 SGNH/GDSL hydrolase family protein [Flavobacterium sedimenticola]